MPPPNWAEPRARRVARRRAAPPPGGGTGAVAASYSRYSSDQQDESSIDQQQQRKCREAARASGHDLRPEFEFSDSAVSGTRPDRQGLQAMIAAAKAGGFQVLYFESLSRLAREFVISAPLLKNLVANHGVRVISTSEGVDSDRAGWELMATFRSWMHTEFLKQLREAVLRGQEEAVLRDYSVGDWCFGYRSEPVPGSESGRRGRNAKPRMRVVIDDDHAAWVRRAFSWFAEDRRPIAWIARELTRLGAPKDHRSTNAHWRASYVAALLRNRKYVGVWAWGRTTNEVNPLTGRVRQVECAPEDALAYTRERPELQIVDDELFFKAQGLLDFNARDTAARRGRGGRLRGSTTDPERPRHLLQGLVKCGACGATFVVAGPGGKYLKCDGYGSGACAVKTQLSRPRAERMILSRVGDAILRDRDWIDQVVGSAQAAWRARSGARPEEFASAEGKVARLLDALEAGEDPDTRGRFRVRQKERDELKRTVTGLRDAGATACGPDGPPTREWVEAKLAALHQVLGSGTPASAVALGDLVGRVVVTEQAPRRGKRKYLRGRFTIAAPAEVGPGSDPSATGLAVEVDFEPSPPRWAAIADRVKELTDRGVRQAEIIAELKCPRSWVGKALDFWHAERGLPRPDGRSERGRLAPRPEDEALRDRAKSLWDTGVLMQQIAAELGCCKETVTALVRDWHTSRGLPVPDGRTRRKSLDYKGKPRGSSPA